MPSCEMLPQAFCPRCEHSPDSLTAELYRTQRHRASTSMVRLVLPFRMVEQVVEKRGRCCLAAVIASRFQGWFSVPSSLRSAYSYHYPSRPSCEIANMGTVVCKFQSNVWESQHFRLLARSQYKPSRVWRRPSESD